MFRNTLITNISNWYYFKIAVLKVEYRRYSQNQSPAEYHVSGMCLELVPYSGLVWLDTIYAVLLCVKSLR